MKKRAKVKRKAVKARPKKSTRSISKTTTIRPPPKNEDISMKCSRCGYKAVKLGNIKECPLCIICIRCGNTVRRCKCIESE